MIAPGRRRPMPALLPVLQALLVQSLAFAPLDVSAHAYLVASEPPHKAVLPAAPASLRLEFSEPIEPAFVKLALSRDGKPVAPPLKFSTRGDARTVVIQPGVSGAGTYQLDWSIVARDGHRTQGNLLFSVKPR